MYIGNIPRNLSHTEIEAGIRGLGQMNLTKFELCVNNEGNSKGYGWATYETHETAIVALKNLQRNPFNGTYLNASFAEPRTFDDRLIEKCKVLYVKNVAPVVSEDRLKGVFGGENVVENVVIPYDKTNGKPLNHAFVHFKEHEDALAALDRLQGFELEGKKLAVEWSVPCAARQKHGAKERTSFHPRPRGPPPSGPEYIGYPPPPRRGERYLPPPPPPPFYHGGGSSSHHNHNHNHRGYPPPMHYYPPPPSGRHPYPFDPYYGYYGPGDGYPIPPRTTKPGYYPPGGHKRGRSPSPDPRYYHGGSRSPSPKRLHKREKDTHRHKPY